MLGVIGGTGLYKLEEFKTIEEINLETPFGNPSAPIVKVQYGKQKIFFLPRHGINHNLFPEEINYRANIFALKSLGVKTILSVSAVGSLKEEIAPGHLIIPDQYFDFVKGKRIKTFFGKGLIAHISTAKPICPQWSQYLYSIGKSLNLDIHLGGIYSCVDGPRLGTQGESFFLKNSVNSSLVGMTNIPEVFLAREAQISYASLCIVTDYDCWREENFATTKDIFKRYFQSLGKVKKFLIKLLKSNLPKLNEDYRQSLKGAILTPENILTSEQKKILDILKL